MTTAEQLLTAIESGELNTRAQVVEGRPFIDVLVGDKLLFAVGSSDKRPTAHQRDTLVQVIASSGEQKIECVDEVDAASIAASLDNCFITSYADLVDPNR